MSADIIPFARPDDADAAWEAFDAHNACADADPTLWRDRAWVVERIRLHDRFYRATLASERA